MGRYLVVIFVCLLLLAACGRSESENAEQGLNISPGAPSATISEEYELGSAEHDMISHDETVYTSAAAQAPGATRGTATDGQPGHGGGATVAGVQRKIIYSADVDLVVDDFAPVAGSVRALVAKHGGFIASSGVHGSAGEPRTGHWTLRVPVGSYDTFLSDAEALGQVRSVTSSSQEVTAEYVDLQARIKTKLIEEERLHTHLSSAVKLDDTLRIERELSRVRGEVEALQGRLNMLADLSAMSTVRLEVREIKDYVPPVTQEPNFAGQLGRAWAGSVAGVKEFLTGLSVLLVAMTPWLVVVVPVGLAFWVCVRRMRRGRQLARVAA